MSTQRAAKQSMSLVVTKQLRSACSDTWVWAGGGPRSRRLPAARLLFADGWLKSPPGNIGVFLRRPAVLELGQVAGGLPCPPMPLLSWQSRRAAAVRWRPPSIWSRNVVARDEFPDFAEIASDSVLSYLRRRGVPTTRARGGRSHGRGQAGQQD